MENNRKNQIEKALAIGTLITGASYGLYCFFKATHKSETTYQCQNSSKSKNDECPICYEIMKNDCRIFDCQHIFHKKCIAEWQKISKTCPLCRNRIDNF